MLCWIIQTGSSGFITPCEMIFFLQKHVLSTCQCLFCQNKTVNLFHVDDMKLTSKSLWMGLFVAGAGMDSGSQILERLRTAFRSGVTLPQDFRRTQLTRLLALVNENEEQIIKALHQDLAKVPVTCVTQSCTCTNTWPHLEVSQYSCATKAWGICLSCVSNDDSRGKFLPLL